MLLCKRPLHGFFSLLASPQISLVLTLFAASSVKLHTFDHLQVIICTSQFRSTCIWQYEVITLYTLWTDRNLRHAYTPHTQVIAPNVESQSLMPQLLQQTNHPIALYLSCRNKFQKLCSVYRPSLEQIIGVVRKVFAFVNNFSENALKYVMACSFGCSYWIDLAEIP